MKIICNIKKLMITFVCLISTMDINKTWATGDGTAKSGQGILKQNAANTIESQDKLHEGQLLQVDLSPYQKDLENIKKLQRDKVKLTLEKENRDLQKELGDDYGGDFRNLINKIFVIDILLTKNNHMARLYIPGRGITIAKVGDKITDDINIVQIEKNRVVATVQLPNAKEFKNIPFHYGSS